MNVLLLWSEALDKGYTAPMRMTYKQAETLGAQVRKGEHGSLVVYADKITKTETDDQGKEAELSISAHRGRHFRAGVTFIAKALLLIQLSLLLGACAALPPRGPVDVSQALPDDDQTTLSRIAAASRPSAETAPSGFRLLPTGEHALGARIALARQAERSVDMQTYHLHGDQAGLALLRKLREAARRGVRVRLLLDDFHAAEIGPLLADLATQPQVQMRLFNPLPLRQGAPLLRLMLTGGNFDRYWNSDTAWPVHAVVARPADAAAAQARLDAAVRDATPPMAAYRSDPLGPTAVDEQLASGRLALPHARAQVFADPPEKALQVPASRQPGAAMAGLLDVLGSARQEALIVSPYFVPGPVGMPMMAAAARNGVRTRVVTNSLATTNEPLVHHHYARYRVAMLPLSVQIHEFSADVVQRSRGFGLFGASTPRLHAKVAIVDQRHCWWARSTWMPGRPSATPR